MTPEVFDFLRELRANNNREWFQDNKKRYDALRADFISDVGQLINRIATFDPEIAGLDARSCVYRIYRDLRFSPDKTPYKTYFSAYMTGFGGPSWQAASGVPPRPCSSSSAATSATTWTS